MSLNSEPVKETNDLLTLIDAGIAALQEDGEAEIELTPDQIFRKPEEK